MENFTSDSSITESGINTSKSSINMTMNLKFHTPPSFNITAHTFINRDVIYRFMNDTTIQVMA